jgi:hypothetical protein
MPSWSITLAMKIQKRSADELARRELNRSEDQISNSREAEKIMCLFAVEGYHKGTINLVNCYAPHLRARELFNVNDGFAVARCPSVLRQPQDGGATASLWPLGQPQTGAVLQARHVPNREGLLQQLLLKIECFKLASQTIVEPYQ